MRQSNKAVRKYMKTLTLIIFDDRIMSDYLLPPTFLFPYC